MKQLILVLLIFNINLLISQDLINPPKLQRLDTTTAIDRSNNFIKGWNWGSPGRKLDSALNVSLQIITAFVEMRKILFGSQNFYNRLINLENKQIQNEHNFNIIFNEMEKSNLPTQGIFFDGQIFDAYVFICNLIKSAKLSIILIDNYIDESVLSILSKNENNVKIKILTKTINSKLKLDIAKFTEQYKEIDVVIFTKSHDRFLIIDDNEFYHIGASIKDLGKKIFAFTKLNKISLELLKDLK